MPTPGATNEALAWSVSALVKEFDAAGRTRPKIMLQWEIAQSLEETYGIKADFVARVDAEGNYLSTFGVMKQIAAKLPVYSTVALVAHPDHAVRCGKVVQRFNMTASGTAHLQLKGGVVEWTQFGCDVHGYSVKSIQPWTTSRTNYLMHEIKNRPDMVIAGQIDFTNDHFRPAPASKL
jgi:hypothetical protein